ncbi:hypothetical protein D3C87_2065220 [compost metagenome]
MTQVFSNIYHRSEDCVRRSFQEYWFFVNIFRTNTHDYFFADVAFVTQQRGFAAWYFNIKVL